VSVPRAEPVPTVAPQNGRLTVDRLADPSELVEVITIDGLDVGCENEIAREPHRHDYHELIRMRSGTGVHAVDDSIVSVAPETVTLIGRGQVHVFAQAEGVSGAAVRFDAQLVQSASAGRADPTWLLVGCGGRVVHVPEDEVAALESTIAALASESARPVDERSADLQRHLLSGLLLWVERWYDAERSERPEPHDAAVQLYRHFARVLERDFARHHDAAHYAEELAVPASALSQALTQASGRSTKELVTERVMDEAARLLRFSDRSVSEIAYLTGFRRPALLLPRLQASVRCGSVGLPRPGARPGCLTASSRFSRTRSGSARRT